MGLPVVRAYVDKSCGHCFVPTIFVQGSQDTFCNNLPVVRQGDQILPHCCGNSCHGGSAVGNGGQVFANNRLIQVVSDAINCGDHSCQGSPDTFCAP